MWVDTPPNTTNAVTAGRMIGREDRPSLAKRPKVMNGGNLWPTSRSWDCLRTQGRTFVHGLGAGLMPFKPSSPIKEGTRSRSRIPPTNSCLGRNGDYDPRSHLRTPLGWNGETDQRCSGSLIPPKLNSKHEWCKKWIESFFPKYSPKKSQNWKISSFCGLQNLIVLRCESYITDHNGLTSPKNHRNKKIKPIHFLSKNTKKKIVSINLKADIVFKQNWS